MKHTSETVQAWLGYLYVEELEALRQLAAELPEGAAVANIGAGGGTSGLVFMESPNNLRLFTVDKQKDASPTGCLAGEEAVFRSAGFWGDPRHKQIHGDSTEIGLMWDGPIIDLLFHDASHDFSKVVQDIWAWRPHIKPGGLFVFHDHDAEKWPGVARAAQQELVDCDLILHVRTLAAYRMPA